MLIFMCITFLTDPHPKYILTSPPPYDCNFFFFYNAVLLLQPRCRSSRRLFCFHIRNYCTHPSPTCWLELILYHIVFFCSQGVEAPGDGDVHLPHAHFGARRAAPRGVRCGKVRHAANAKRRRKQRYTLFHAVCLIRITISYMSGTW